MAKKITEINASSMADISFLLLIFFLVTTSMDVNKGLARRLPPPMEEDKELDDSEVNERDIMEVKINWENKLLVEGEPLDVRELRAKAKEFVDPAITGENMPVVADTILPEPFGKQPFKNKHVISLQTDGETSYQAYLEVQNELVAAYNELRNECANKYYGKSFVELEEAEQKNIEAIYPVKLSEAEPKRY